MQNVPKIVRERLRAATPAVNHPDADVLTAFAERSLPELERAGVFEHLSRCGDCRDIVALALPATEPVETPVRSATSGWLTWPVLRWGFVAAGVVAIASLGILQYQRRIQPATMASRQTPHLEVAANESKKAIAQFVAPAPAEKRDKLQSPAAAPAFTDSVDSAKAIVLEKKSIAGKSIEKDRLERKSTIFGRAEAPSAPTPPASGGSMGASIGGPLPHGPRLANQWTQQNAIQNQAAAPAPPTADAKQTAAAQPSANIRVPAASETVEVESQTAQLNTEGRSLEPLKIQDLPAAQQPPGEDYALAHVDKAKPAMTTQSPKSAPSAPTISGAVPSLAALNPRWSITSVGGLQRSFDQGNTWQNVDVNANPGSFHGAAYVGATDLDVAAKTSRAKAKDADQALKRETTPPTFRAVAASGADVWAGGSAGALFHSLDGGNHWTRVVPATAGTFLTGDIVSLQFPDPQHGKVSTSTAEVWTTSDDGQSWRKQ